MAGMLDGINVRMPGDYRQPDGQMGKKEEQKQQSLQLNDVLLEMREVSRRLRVLEDRYSGLRKSMQVSEQNTISLSKKSVIDVKALNNENVELKKNIRNLGEELTQIIKELKLTAKKDDVKVIDRYVNLWQPMSYVTYEEMDNRIKIIVKEELKKSNIKI